MAFGQGFYGGLGYGLAPNGQVFFYTGEVDISILTSGPGSGQVIEIFTHPIQPLSTVVEIFRDIVSPSRATIGVSKVDTERVSITRSQLTQSLATIERI